MGRTKTYDRDEVAKRAMHAFWSTGYHSTTARQLAEATGLNVSSLCAEFGSKEGLYEAAVACYERDMVTLYIGDLEKAGATLATLRTVLLQYPAFARAEAERRVACCATRRSSRRRLRSRARPRRSATSGA